MQLHPRTYPAPPSERAHGSTTIDPTIYVASTLIAQIAGGWLTFNRNSGNMPSTIVNRASIIRNLGQYLTEPTDELLSLDAPTAELPRRLLDWERGLIVEHGPASGWSKRASAILRQYVLAYLLEHSIDNPYVHHWAQAKGLQYRDLAVRSIPLDEFSNRERLAIESRFRDIVRAGERLQAIGDALLDQGEDPRHTGWESIANLVWAFHNLPLNKIPRRAWEQKTIPQWWTALELLVPETAQLKPHIFGNPLMGLVIPNLYHLQALRCLMLLRTGWPPEEILHLKNEDIEFGDTAVCITTRKDRAARVHHRELSSRATDGTYGWSPGDLLRRANVVMKYARNQVPNHPDFWIGALAQPFFAQRASTLPAWLSSLPSSPYYSFSRLTRRAGLDISAPLDTRRLRKTHKSAKAVLLGTLAGSAGDDHTIEVFRSHYAQSTTVHTIAARTVLNAQELVMSNIGPTVVVDSAEHTAQLHQDDPVGVAAATTTHESPTDATLAVSGCTDPTNPPHTSSQHCLDAPQQCLTCSNAVIFKDHLPRLVGYRAILKELEPEMAPQQFAALYGQQIVNIDTILSQFPRDEVEAAHTNPTFVRVPLTMRKGR